jgi:hypothetical protein
VCYCNHFVLLGYLSFQSKWYEMDFLMKKKYEMLDLDNFGFKRIENVVLCFESASFFVYGYATNEKLGDKSRELGI